MRAEIRTIGGHRPFGRGNLEPAFAQPLEVGDLVTHEQTGLRTADRVINAFDAVIFRDANLFLRHSTGVFSYQSVRICEP